MLRDPVARTVHEALLFMANGDSTAALRDAALWIAELQAQIEVSKTLVSSGLIRKDTSELYKTRVEIKPPLDISATSDDWLNTANT